MPVTAKLSRKFYERFGDDLTNELVEWFNQVDATYRGDLRELNELNWARSKAEMNEGFARVRSEMSVTQAELRAEMSTFRADLRAEMAAMKAELVRWMFLFWATTLIALVEIARLK